MLVNLVVTERAGGVKRFVLAPSKVGSRWTGQSLLMSVSSRVGGLSTWLHSANTGPGLKPANDRARPRDAPHEKERERERREGAYEESASSLRVLVRARDSRRVSLFSRCTDPACGDRAFFHTCSIFPKAEGIPKIPSCKICAFPRERALFFSRARSREGGSAN